MCSVPYSPNCIAVIWADGEEYGTAPELAARFKVSVWTIYKWRKLHGLPTLRVNGRDYSPVLEAARIDLAKRDTPAGAPRQLDTGMIAA